ncbi:unnamed protein product [Pylaiella littoralis]
MRCGVTRLTASTNHQHSQHLRTWDRARILVAANHPDRFRDIRLTMDLPYPHQSTRSTSPGTRCKGVGGCRNPPRVRAEVVLTGVLPFFHFRFRFCRDPTKCRRGLGHLPLYRRDLRSPFSVEDYHPIILTGPT